MLQQQHGVVLISFRVGGKAIEVHHACSHCYARPAVTFPAAEPSEEEDGT